MQLSKSKFLSGLQCHRQLWWTVHDRDALELEVGPAQQLAFDHGAQVGELAREYVFGGVLIDFPYYQVKERVAATERAILQGAKVIYEASFFADGVFVAVDILHRRRRGWTLSEVKSTTKLKPVHIPDAAIQTHVLRRAGLELERSEVMHLNRDCRHPELAKLFVRTDVTDEVEEFLPKIPREVRRQLRMLEGELPDADCGHRCSEPYECPFTNRCWEDEAETETETETALCIAPELGEALAALERPLAFLDFETVALPIPVWPGCRPYDAVPVQLSCHVEDASGELRHHEWLGDDPGDPREPFARALIRAVRGARTILAYNASFELGRIRELADALPHLEKPLASLARRVRDLLPIVRRHVTHPGFRGSYSLKRVLPVLVPELRHAELEIQEGATASAELERLLFAGAALSEPEREKLRAALLAYCRLDTLGMVKIVERLRAETSLPRRARPRSRTARRAASQA